MRSALGCGINPSTSTINAFFMMSSAEPWRSATAASGPVLQLTREEAIDQLHDAGAARTGGDDVRLASQGRQRVGHGDGQATLAEERLVVLRVADSDRL